jgi:Ni/Fe-hydrogenase subunit HybB-like protein
MPVLFSSSWWIFWLIQVGVGVIVPVYLVFFARKTRLLLGLAGLATVIGIVGVRWNILVPGQVVPKVEGIADVLGSARFSVAYLPSAVEILATAGLVALFLLLITLGFKYLPLGGSESDSTSEGGH